MHTLPLNSLFHSDCFHENMVFKEMIKDNTPTGASTNPKNFDLNENFNLLGTLIILDSASI